MIFVGNKRLFKTYFYTQTLDSGGDTQYFKLDRRSCRIFHLNSSSNEGELIRQVLDSFSNTGRQWRIANHTINCKVTFYGDCLICLEPDTRDESGRISPIMMLLNVYDNKLNLDTELVENLEKLTNRKFNENYKSNIKRLFDFLNGNKFYLFLHILFNSKGF
ncbi:hypothetical protein CWC02_06105 [Pseudoalteromonas sp. S2721]|nr:hypothetical protein CWC02_06105 [Pseudoalteromonas sp. S2721]